MNEGMAVTTPVEKQEYQPRGRRQRGRITMLLGSVMFS